MTKLITLLAVLALTGCAGVGDGRPAVRSMGNGLYSVSEMDTLFSSPTVEAANWCGNRGLKIVGNTAQHGMYSGTNYSILLFRCEP